MLGCSRNRFAALAVALWLAAGSAGAELPVVKVFKTATCGCCTKWVEHLRADGFTVEAVNVEDLWTVKQAHGVPRPLSSCHTAVVDEYFVEGHVPASDVRRLLEERPVIVGIGVPGMPIGSPGMEGPNPERYQVFALAPDGTLEVYSTHGP